MQKNIHIQQPCHESWNNMLPQGEGRHCDSCEKVVKDFTKMSDEELIAYMQTSKAGDCGRFREDQVRTVFGNKHTWFYNFRIKSAALFGLMFAKFFAADHASAQDAMDPKNIDDIKNDQYSVKNLYNDSVVYHITGTVMNKDGDVVRYAIVKVKVNGKPVGGSVYADNKGNFVLNVKAANSDDIISLEFSKDRHRTVRLRQYTPDGKPLEIKMKEKWQRKHRWRDRYIMGAYAFYD